MFGFSWINIFMFLAFYITLPIVWVSMRNERKPKKNVVLGVTLPRSLRESELVKQIGEQYKKEQDRIFWILTVIGVFGLVFRYVSVALTWYMIWIMAVLIVPYLPFVRAWKQLRIIKAEQGYEQTGEVQTVYVDTSAIEECVKEPSPWWYLPPMVMGLIPCVLGFSFWNTQSFLWMELCYLTMLGCIALFFFLAYRGYRHQRMEMVDERTELTLALTRVRRYNWHRMSLWSAWMTGLFSLAMYFLTNQVGVFLLSTGIYLVVIVYLALHTEFSVRRAQEKLTEDCDLSEIGDEDRYWLWGSIYYNPHDKHVLKNNRTGMNMTMNLATKTGKVVAMITVVLILSLPLVGVWLMAEEFTPIKFSLTNETLVVNHLKKEYTVELDEILSAEILDELPRTGKDIGTNMDTLLKGQFRVDGYGTCKLCLNPQEDRFLVIVTADETYIFSPQDEIIQQVIDFVRD